MRDRRRQDRPGRPADRRFHREHVRLPSARATIRWHRNRRTSHPRRSGSSICSWPARQPARSFRPQACADQARRQTTPSLGHWRSAVCVYPPGRRRARPAIQIRQVRPSGAELSEMLPHLAQVVDEIAIIKSVHTDQFDHAPRRSSSTQVSRSQAGPAWVRGSSTAWARSAGPARLRRDVDRQRDQRRLGQLVERVLADHLHRHSPAQPGRPDPERVEPAWRGCRTSARLARPDRFSEQPPASGRRRPRDRHANRRVRDGLPAANVGPRVDGFEERTQNHARGYGADPDKPSFARPACWRGG